MSEEKFVCRGCGREGTVTDFPWVAIGSEDLDGPGGEPEKFVSYDVCDDCHKNPAHRSKHGLKLHFFPRAAKRMALINAREQTLLEDPTSEQAAKQKEYLRKRATAQRVQ